MAMQMPKIISSKEAVKEFRKRSVSGADIFVDESVISKIALHAELGYLENEEVMGLIMGTVYVDDEGEYAVAKGTATSGLVATDSSVKFDPDTIEDLFSSMDENECKTVVGWYHSHPGFGCYLSDTDMRSHTEIFGDRIGFSVVLDPSDETLMVFIKDEGEFRKAQMIISEAF